MIKKEELEKLNKEELIDIIFQNNAFNNNFVFKNPVTRNVAYSLIEFDIPVLITDNQIEEPGPVIVFCNSGFEKMSGYKQEEILGKTPRLFQGEKTDKEVLKNLKNCLINNEHFRGIAINYRKDGSEFYNQWGIEPIYDINKNITHYISMHTDVTELKLIEKELTYQINQKNTFFSILSHDLKNPLTGFLTLTQLIKDKAGDLTFNKLMELIRTLNNAANSLNDLLGNLLIWSRAQTDNYDVNIMRLQLLDKIKNIVNLFVTQAQNKNITIKININEKEIIESDPFIFDTIFRNLINNAIKFSNPDSEIIIDFETINNKKYIRIKDFGVGIKQEKIPDLFDISKKVTTLGTNREKGTGLGLKLCKELAQKQGSEIGVESTLGKGSIFSLILV